MTAFNGAKYRQRPIADVVREFQLIREKHVLVVDDNLIGATKAAQADLGAFAIIFLATVTAVAGGLFRDISIREVPQILYRDFYASPAIFLGVMYSIFSSYMQKSLCVYALITCTFLLRLLAIHFKMDLWGPRKKNAQ